MHNRKNKVRGMNLLAARTANGNYIVMGINHQLESCQFGDAICALLNEKGRVQRRADMGEFLNAALKQDDVEQRVFPEIQKWEFPQWECLAYENHELWTTYYLYRRQTVTAVHQYGRLEVHVGPQSSGQPLTGNGRTLIHRNIIDAEIECDYDMEVLPGYAIDTVVEALPTFKPMRYDEWHAEILASQAIPFDFCEEDNTTGPSIPYPPSAFMDTAARWIKAVEFVAGQPLGKPYTCVELMPNSYIEVLHRAGLAIPQPA